MIHYDTLLQNVTDIITKWENYFTTKCDKSLFFATKYHTFITKCDSYYKWTQFYCKRWKLLQNATFIINFDSTDHMSDTLHLVQWWIKQVKLGEPAEHLYVYLCILYFMYMFFLCLFKKLRSLKKSLNKNYVLWNNSESKIFN